MSPVRARRDPAESLSWDWEMGEGSVNSVTQGPVILIEILSKAKIGKK